MPYIKQEDRAKFIWNERADVPTNCGELNFLISDICNSYWLCHDQKYQTINDIIGALEGAKLEFYRRIAAKYEDQKIIENGDVY